MKILSYNINQMLGTASFRAFKGKQSEQRTLQTNNLKKLLDYVCNFISDTDNLAILEEVPYTKQSVIYNRIRSYFRENPDYEIQFPSASENKKAFFCIAAVYRKKSKWKRLNIDEKNFLSKAIIDNRTTVLFHNRVIGMAYNDYKIIGIHIPATNYTPAASVLWDDLMYYCKNNNIDLILGDLNVDADDTIQARKYNELIQMYHEPENQPATKTCEGMPITNHICNSHIDYALVKKGSLAETLIEEYVIESNVKDSDHYPIRIGIK